MVLGFLFAISKSSIFHPPQETKPHFERFKPMNEAIKSLETTAFEDDKRYLTFFAAFVFRMEDPRLLIDQICYTLHVSSGAQP